MTELVNPLVDAMSNADLLKYKEANPNNESLVKLVDGILEVRKHQAEQEAIKQAFLASLKVDLPNPPEGVYNVYRAYGKVFRPLTKEERKEYLKLHPEVTKEELDAKRLETDKWEWGDWIINKGFSPSGSKSTTPKAVTPKRAITVKRVEGDSLVLVGNFRNGAEACKHLHLDTGGDSAMRVLQRFGYHSEAYDGADFLIKVEA
jgi:hypothetical protein